MRMPSLSHGSSILIPTWNNLEYLRGLVVSLRKHSKYDHQIIVHVNDGRDGTLDFVRNEKIMYTHSDSNIGICRGINECAKLADRETIIWFNDDMAVLPDWDYQLEEFIKEYDLSDKSWISCMLIEGFGRNPNIIAGKRYNYGRDINSYDEGRIIEDIVMLKKRKPIISGSTWTPNLMSSSMWKEIDGFSNEYDECRGFGCDPDLAKKMWDNDCRNFLACPTSLVYHFGSKVTGRYDNRKWCIRRSREIFENKYEMSIKSFVDEVLRRGEVWKGH